MLAWSTGCQTFESAGEASGAVGGAAERLVDNRPAVTRDVAPPSIGGGTLLALSDGKQALVADPDRHRVQLVDYVARSVRTIALPEGSEPGRAVEGPNGQAFLVLRGSGELATVDIARGELVERRAVCAMPRGVAFDTVAGRLWVACAEGKLVDLPLVGSERVESPLPRDARDVVFAAGKPVISRFRSAEILQLERDKSVIRSNRLPSVAAPLHDTGDGSLDMFDASVAWRTQGMPDGSVVVVHQRATTASIDVHPGGETGAEGESSYGAGAGSGCGGIVHTAVSVVSQDGTVVTSQQLRGVVLPVDVAVSRNGTVVVASAGAVDLGAPIAPNFNPKRISSSIGTFNLFELNGGFSGQCTSGFSFAPIAEPVVAVAIDPVSDRTLAQTRQPATLIVVDSVDSSKIETIALGGEDVTDTGHEIFHRDSGGGLACASCHAEGKDDGRVWNFTSLGPRRTQPIDVGLTGTEPFHWDGSLATLDELMNEVFVTRMAGPRESPERVGAVSNWLAQQRTRPALRAQGDAAALRGQELFESPTLACATCHAGPKFTSAGNFDVGTGGEFQVPSLLGVAHRTPLLHDGCASTLRERFDSNCGGFKHGSVSQLDEGQIQDVVAYLETL